MHDFDELLLAGTRLFYLIFSYLPIKALFLLEIVSERLLNFGHFSLFYSPERFFKRLHGKEYLHHIDIPKKYQFCFFF